MNSISIENQLKQVDDTLIHVGYVMEAGRKLIKELLKKGQEKQAMELLQRIMKHDYSKSSESEFYGLSAFSDDVAALKDPMVNTVQDGKFQTIRLHWQNNDHHPEYWADQMPKSFVDETPLVINENMPDMAIAEMCCDWFARSAQYKTNVWEFYEMRTKTRWKFTDKQHELIQTYLTLLLSESEE